MATTRVDTKELARLRRSDSNHQLLMDRVSTMFYVITGVYTYFSSLFQLPSTTVTPGSMPGMPTANNGWEFDFGLVRVIVYPLRDRVVIIDSQDHVDQYAFTFHDFSIGEREQMTIMGFLARVKRAHSEGVDSMTKLVDLIPGYNDTSS